MRWTARPTWRRLFALADDATQPARTQPTHIHVKGAREHNLKQLELRIARDRLVVFTGVSGSGKSSLAFDTLYAEGYRKFMESLSARTRAAMEQIDKPDVDFIHGLSPVIAIEQRTAAGANPRSTVATVTEIADYARMLWCVAGEQRDPIDGAPIQRRSLDDCIARVYEEPEGSRLILLAPWLTARAAVLREELPRIRQKGYQRIRLGGALYELRDGTTDIEFPKGREAVSLELVVDRIVLRPDQRSRLADSLELTFKEGGDRALVLAQTDREAPFKEIVLSQKLAGVNSGVVYEPLTPKHFSWNHAEGACPACGGLGQTLQFQPELVVPDPTLTVKSGAIKPWRLGSKSMIIQRNAILKQLAEQLPFDPKVPWSDLAPEVRQQILYGCGERLFTFKLKRGNTKPEATRFEGVIADLEASRRDTKSDGFRAKLMAFQTASVCTECKGARLNARARHVTINGVAFTDFVQMSIQDAAAFIRNLVEGR